MNVKYILAAAVCFISCLVTLGADSAVMIDAYGTSVYLGDEDNVKGGGLSVAASSLFDSFIDNLGLYGSVYVAGRRDNENEPNEETRLLVPGSIGLRYAYPFEDIPLNIEFFTGAGLAYFKKEGPERRGSFFDPSETRIETTNGKHFEFLGGISYCFTQHFAVFVNGGYQITKFDADDIAEDASGIQFSVGIRCIIGGESKELPLY